MAACKKQIRTPAEFEQLRTAIGHYAVEVRGKDPQYTKHFSTFMGCWRDYIAAPDSQKPDPRGPDPLVEETRRIVAEQERLADARYAARNGALVPA